MSEEKKCTGDCKTCKSHGDASACQMAVNLPNVKHKIVVMSGKGGVGKSTVATNLATALALDGKSVGLLDVDLHGPSIPTMLGMKKIELSVTGDGEKIVPPMKGSLKVMSIGFMLESEDNAVVWRGPMKIGVIRQLLSDVDWGELDCLVIDCPPGTGDEPLSVCQMLPDADGAVIVTTPQQVAAADVTKSLSFCNQLGFKVIGIVENMSGFVCPKCGEVTEIFSSGAGMSLAEKFHTAFLGKIPIDPYVCQGGDKGNPFVYSASKAPGGKAFIKIVEAIEAVIGM